MFGLFFNLRYNTNDAKNENDSSEEKQNPRVETVDGKDYYYDDNSKLYRIDNNLESNSEYEINGYKYQTD